MNKVCAYCGKKSATGDHVIARSFFPEHLRSDLPVVPACAECNTNKSRIEHYLATVLPLAGNDGTALLLTEQTLQRKLAHNISLQEELIRGFELHKDVNMYGLHGTILRPEMLAEYAKFIARGLLCYHFKYEAGTLLYVRGAALPHSRSFTGDELYATVAPMVTSIVGNLASGTVQYRGFAAKDNVGSSFWQIRIYGGLNLGAELHDGSGRLVDRYDLMAMTLRPVA